MTLGSFFDGIGGWLLAAIHAGVKPIWASEIDDFPAAVTAHHFPNVRQIGDITKIDVDNLEPVDIICAGSPCQDLSVAGKRKGLKGERSGLFVDAIKLVHGLRKRTGKPRYFVWENVPGAFSSNKGLDFRAVLEEISQTSIPMPANNKWAESGVVEWDSGSLAWRVLDAQYWGVPQRRKRIFLVADFAGHSAGEILFECQGLPRNPTESEGTGKESAGNVRESIKGTGKVCVIENHPQDSRIKIREDNVVQTLSSQCGTGGENNVPMVMDIEGVGIKDGIAGTLDSNYYKGQGVRGGIERTAFCVGNGQVDQTRISDKVGTLNCMHDQQAVMVNKAIRRLTPTECERLQGLPDGYTDIEFNGKPAPGNRRYKALGNGMAQPCADYVIKRIVDTYIGKA